MLPFLIRCTSHLLKMRVEKLVSPLVIITGVGRRNNIAYAVAQRLASKGWDLVINYWGDYDRRLNLFGGSPSDIEELQNLCQRQGRQIVVAEANLEDVHTPKHLCQIAQELGDFQGMVLAHCESVDRDVLSTTIEEWDRHFAVNVRANWLLIQEFAHRANTNPHTIKRVVALTSDHTAHNLPYGSSKGALDRLVIAAGIELGARGFRCNALNPGPINTGWMNSELEETLRTATPAGRLGTLLHANGGFGAQ